LLISNKNILEFIGKFSDEDANCTVVKIVIDFFDHGEKSIFGSSLIININFDAKEQRIVNIVEANSVICSDKFIRINEIL